MNWLCRHSGDVGVTVMVKSACSGGALLDRFVDAGLLRKAAKGPRGRHEFSLTPEGEGEVENGNLNRYLEDSLRSATRRPGIRPSTRVPRDRRGQPWNCKEASVGSQGRTPTARSACQETSKQRRSLRSRLGGLYSKALAQCEAQQEAAMRTNWNRSVGAGIL